MKKIFKSLLLVLVIMLGVIFITGCDNKKDNDVTNEEVEKATDEQDRKYEEIRSEIEVLLQSKFEEIYGDKIVNSRIYVGDIYSSEYDELLKYNLSEDDYGFEVTYELKPNENIDPNELLSANGRYDEETGWIVDVIRVGIIKKVNGKYEITSFGTSF